MKKVTCYVQTPKGHPHYAPMDEVIFNIARMEENPLGVLLSAIKRVRKEEQKTRDFYETQEQIKTTGG